MNEKNIKVDLKSKYKKFKYSEVTRKSLLLFFITNYKIILLLPTLMGGFYQFICLSRINPQFIKFFSISQLISDGLLILFLIIFTIAIPVYFLYFTSALFINSQKYVDNQIDFKDKMFTKILNVICVFILMALVLFVMYWKYDNITVNTSQLSLFFIYLIPIFGYFIFYNFTILVKKNEISKPFNLMDITIIANNFFVKIICFLSLISISIVFFHLIDKLTNEGFVDNLTNVKNISEIVENKYGINDSNYEIKYFNDKYIFIEHKGSCFKTNNPKISIEKNKEILILQFEELFK